MGKLRRDGKGAWHTSEAAEVLRALETDAESGLSDKEAGRRFAEQGPNDLETAGFDEIEVKMRLGEFRFRAIRAP